MQSLPPAEVMMLARAAMLQLLILSGPMLIASLIIGVAIGLLQALTQIWTASDDWSGCVVS